MKITKNSSSILALSALILGSSLYSANYREGNTCKNEAAATCYSDSCSPLYCLGPENTGSNPPARPRTCSSDVSITVAGLYWKAQQEGMEYAVHNHVENVDEERDTLIDSKYLSPNFKGDFGFKLGIGYNTPCDGWDVGVLWTHYNGKASSHVEAEEDDNAILLPLWINTGVTQFDVPIYVTDIETKWKASFNIIDLELGREFWNSKYLSIRPHMGLRIAFIDQDYDLHHKGGSLIVALPDRNNFVKLSNDFHGVGVRGGLDTNWNVGCGFALYGNLAFSILYGQFSLNHDETNRQVAAPFDKEKVLETRDHFRASKMATDLSLGLQYSTRFCECKYALIAMLGYEHQLFLNQNQMWRVPTIQTLDNSRGLLMNIYNQRRGNLSTQGVTLTLKFDF